MKFIRFYLFIILILILFGNIAFAENFNSQNISLEFTNSNFHYNKNSQYIWPIFGYYSISSYFGKRTSPTARSFKISFWN